MSAWTSRIRGSSALFAACLTACSAAPVTHRPTVLLPGGVDLVFGAPAAAVRDARADEGPRVRSLPPFEIAVHLVTNAEFCGFLNSAAAAHVDAARLLVTRDFPQFETCPIVRREGRWQCEPDEQDSACEQATWFGAFSFCRWLTTTRNDGFVYSLPSEWQWEHAVRGVECRTWPWGDDPPGPERGDDGNARPGTKRACGAACASVATPPAPHRRASTT